MKKIVNSLQEVFLGQLRDLYSAETQIIKALPAMQKAAKAPELKKGFALHLEETKRHATRIMSICEALGKKPGGKKCVATAGLIAEGKEALDEPATPQLKDVMIIGAARRLEHYEIAAYTGICVLAQALGNASALKLLAETLSEEVATDAALSQNTAPIVARSLAREGQEGEKAK